jgi:hypothetical protein
MSQCVGYGLIRAGVCTDSLLCRDAFAGLDARCEDAGQPTGSGGAAP